MFANQMIFDPCCFYGHYEYDLAIGEIFGGFRSTFHQHYQKVMKRVEGSDSITGIISVADIVLNQST